MACDTQSHFPLGLFAGDDDETQPLRGGDGGADPHAAVPVPVPFLAWELGCTKRDRPEISPTEPSCRPHNFAAGCSRMPSMAASLPVIAGWSPQVSIPKSLPLALYSPSCFTFVVAIYYLHELLLPISRQLQNPNTYCCSCCKPCDLQTLLILA